MSSAMGLRMNNLVPKLFDLCYDSGIVSLSLYLSLCLYPCLDMDKDMVLLELPFTSHIEKYGQQPLYVL